MEIFWWGFQKKSTIRACELVFFKKKSMIRACELVFFKKKPISRTLGWAFSQKKPISRALGWASHFFLKAFLSPKRRRKRNEIKRIGVIFVVVFN